MNAEKENISAKILVVDDAPDYLLFLCHILESAGYEVHTAPDGKADYITKIITGTT